MRSAALCSRVLPPVSPVPPPPAAPRQGLDRQHHALVGGVPELESVIKHSNCHGIVEDGIKFVLDECQAAGLQASKRHPSRMLTALSAAAAALNSCAIKGAPQTSCCS